MNELIEQLVKEELGRDNPVPVEVALAQILADRVSELLREDPKWALQILRRANARSPVEGVLKERMAHYAKDKERFSDALSAWLYLRISKVMSQKQNAFLLLDAGSTILKLCPTLWRKLGELEKLHHKSKLTIITSNYPAASSWTQYLESTVDGSDPRETTEFELLGGKLQRKYGALTGQRTEDVLGSLSDLKTRPPGRYFAVVAGNYIRAEVGKDFGWPVPLVRGEGQQRIKEAYVNAGDEIYVAGATPGKIFLASRAEVCDRLKQPAYHDVRIPENKRRKVKLVSSLRSLGILTVHCSLVRKTFANWITDIESKEPPDEITAIGHLLYNYNVPVLADKVTTLTDAIQLSVEFPHQFPSGSDLRDSRFKPAIEMVRDLFHVDTESILRSLPST